MKTYQEALDAIHVRVESPDGVDGAVKVLTDRVQRHADLLQEIMDNPQTHKMLADIIDLVEEERGCNVDSLAISVFINGIMIGMEMERDDSRRIE